MSHLFLNFPLLTFESQFFYSKTYCIIWEGNTLCKHLIPRHDMYITFLWSITRSLQILPSSTVVNLFTSANIVQSKFPNFDGIPRQIRTSRIMTDKNCSPTVIDISWECFSLESSYWGNLLLRDLVFSLCYKFQKYYESF